MPLNTDIAMGFRMPQIEGPLDQYSKFMTLKNAMMQQQHASQQMRDQQLVRDALQSGTNPDETLDRLMKVSPSAASQYAGVMKQREAVKMQQGLSALTPEQRMDPDLYRRLGMATGNAAFTAEAERLQRRRDQQEQLKSLQGDEALLGQRVIEAGKAGQPMTLESNVPGAGVYGSLISSEIPSIAEAARSAQEALNKGVGTPDSHMQRANMLAQREGSLLEARSRQQAQFGQQRDMAGVVAGLRQQPRAWRVIPDPSSSTKFAYVDQNTGEKGSEAPPPNAASSGADERQRLRMFTDEIKVPRQQLQQFESYQQAKDTWKSGEKVPQAYIAAAQQFLQMARTNRQFKGELENALGGGNVAQRIWGSLDRVVTGEPSTEQLADLDRAVNALAQASANNIGTAVRNARQDAITAGHNPDKVVGGPKVYGSYYIEPTGRVIQMKSNAAALKAAQMWRERQDEGQ